MKISRLAILLLFLLAAFSNAKLFVSTLAEPTIYHKDFLNHYVVGKATLLGINPYEEISKLAKTFVGPQVGQVFPHPSPYPPPNALLFAPFGALSYRSAVIVWHILQALSLFFVLFLLAHDLHRAKRFLAMLAVGLLAFAFNAVAEDFIWGNSMLVLLVPLTLSWFCLRRCKDWSGGALLGTVIALKVIAWPLLILLAFRKNWRAIAGAVAAIVIANLAAASVVGFDNALYYYRTVTIIVTPLYRARIDNFSMYAVAWRFFAGTGSPIFDTLRAEPLVYAPQVATVAAIVLPLLTVIATFYFASKTRSFDLQFALALCACVVIGPFAWRAYLVWLALPLAVAKKQLQTASPKKRVLAVGVAILLFGYPTPLSMLAAAFMREGQSTAPFIASLLTLIPLFAVGGLFVLLFSTRTEGKAIVDVRDHSGPVCGLLGIEDRHLRKVTFECVAADCRVSK